MPQLIDFQDIEHSGGKLIICIGADNRGRRGYLLDVQLAVGGCPETSDSGQLNLLKPALENQSLAGSRMAGFLGKGIRSCGRL